MVVRGSWQAQGPNPGTGRIFFITAVSGLRGLVWFSDVWGVGLARLGKWA